MPYVIAKRLGKGSKTVEATLCDAGCFGPVRRSGVPVKVRLISERVLAVDDEPRPVIWCRGGDGVVTFLIEAGRKAFANRARRAALEKAHAQLQQLASSLRPLTAESEEPENATEGLGLLFNWFASERERVTAAPRSDKAGY
jgi:hypothetical protein